MPCLICEFHRVWICLCGAPTLILLATSSMVKRHRLLGKVYTYEFTSVPLLTYIFLGVVAFQLHALNLVIAVSIVTRDNMTTYAT